MSQLAHSQCPQIYDGLGILQDEPQWVSCSGTDLVYNIAVQSPDPLGSYTIDWGDGTNSVGASLAAETPVTHAYPAVVDTFIVEITDHDAGCTIDGLVVIEFPLVAELGAFGGVTTTCAPGDLTFRNNTNQTSGKAISETAVFRWDYGDGTPVETYDYTNAGQTVTHTYARNSVDCQTVVTLEAENYCGTFTATLNPAQIWDLDDAAIDASAVLLCYPDTTVDFRNVSELNCDNPATEGNVYPRQEYWDFGDYWGVGSDSIIDWSPFPPAPTHTIAYPGRGTYQVMLIDSNYCGQDTVFETIQIVDPPIADFIASSTVICEGQSITFTNTSTAGATGPAPDSFIWNFGDGTGNFNTGGGAQTHTFNSDGTFTVTLTAFIAAGTGSCTHSETMNVTVEPAPVANVVLSGDEACDSLTVAFTNASSGDVAWSWDFGNGNSSNLENPADEDYIGDGTYTVQLDVTSANGCTDADTETIEIYASPVPAFTPLQVCEDIASQFTDLSTEDASDPITDWDWDFDDGAGSTDQNPTHTYTDTGTYRVALEVTTATCAASDTFDLEVTVKPIGYMAYFDTAGCSPFTVALADSSTTGSIRTWYLDGGNTSTDSSLTHTFTNNGTADTVITISLVVGTGSGCGDSIAQQITVHPVPTAGFTQTGTDGSCAPLSNSFTNTSANAVSYNWDFDDGSGSTSTDPVHTFQNQTKFAQTYDIELVALNADGCSDTVINPLTLYPEAIFPFSSVPDSGCSPLSITFTVDSSGAAAHAWDFGDGSTSTASNPSHTFINSTTNDQDFTVELIATNGFLCKDTTYETVTVFPKPTADFFTDTTRGCHPAEIEFSNASTADSYAWNFDNGTTSSSTAGSFTQSFENTTSSLVTYDVELIASTTKGCHDTDQVSILVNPIVLADYTADTTGCHPWPVAFNNNSTNHAASVWDFDDGGVSISSDPNHTFNNGGSTDGNYDVKLVVTSVEGCQDSLSRTVVVYPLPAPDFDLDTSAGCTPFTPVITNTTTAPATNYEWEFNDGSAKATTDQVSHTYTNGLPTTQSFDIQLVAFTANGCSDTLVQSVAVYPAVVAGFAMGQEGCHPYVSSTTNTSSGADSYQWDYGDGGGSTATSESHEFNNPSTINDVTYTVELIALSDLGCSDTADTDVLVHPKPSANISLSDTAGCHPFSPVFTNNSSLDTLFSINFQFGDGTADNVERSQYTHSYANTAVAEIASSYTYNARIETTDGCSDTATGLVYVYPETIALFDSLPGSCSPYQYEVESDAKNADQIEWRVNGLLAGTAEELSGTRVNSLKATDEVVNLSLSVTSVFGCQDTLDYDFVVWPKPEAIFEASDSTGCQPLGIDFTSNSAGKHQLSYDWDFDDGNASSDSVFSHSFQNLGADSISRNISLVVTSPDGCRDTAEMQASIYPPVAAVFQVDTSGCGPLTVEFNDFSQNAVGYSWVFGDGTNSATQVPTHTFGVSHRDTVYTTTLIVDWNGYCPDTATQDIHVYGQPDLNITPASAAGCHPFSQTFSNTSGGASSFTWDFGDGDKTSSGFVDMDHTYTNQGNIPIDRFVQISGANDHLCSSDTQITITVNPILEGEIDMDKEGCHPFTEQLAYTAEGPVDAAQTIWVIDQSTVLNEDMPQYTFVNEVEDTLEYGVELQLTSPYGCQDTIVDTVMVFLQPVANFTVTPGLQIFPDNKVFLENETYPPSEYWRYRWEFSDGVVLVAEEPQEKVFLTWGDYDLTLEVSSPTCDSTLPATVRVIAPPPVADFDGEVVGCNPVTVTFQNNSEYGERFIWDFGDGNTLQQDDQQDVTWIYQEVGTFDVSLTVIGYEDQNGDIQQDVMGPETRVEVYENLKANAMVVPSVVSVPNDPTQMVNLTGCTDSCSYIWDFGDDIISYGENPTHYYKDPGLYDVTLVAETRNGCLDTIVLPQAVLAESSAAIVFPDAFTPSSTGPNGGRYDPTSFDNDIFFPLTEGVEEYHLQIFNRWGELIFESFDVNIGWDGYYREQLCKQEVYVWKVTAIFQNGDQKVTAGDVTLLR